MTHMTTRRQYLWPIAAAVALLVVAAGCHEQASPSPPPAPSQPAPQATQTAPASQPAATRPAATRPTPSRRRFTITNVGIKPDQPFSIVTRINSQKPARILASLPSDHLLNIETINVDALRLDVLNLPRKRAGRLILHIDDQGMEITGRGSKIIYLQRTSAGTWQFTKAPTPTSMSVP